MKSSKERKMERKAKYKALSVEKTVKSRKRRLDNKAKRAEIHAINPDIKIVIKDQITYDELGTELMVENGQVKCVEPEMLIPLPNMEQAKQMGEEILEVFKNKAEVFDNNEDMENKLLDIIKIKPTVEVFDAEVEEVEAVEVDDISRFQTLIKKWRL